MKRLDFLLPDAVDREEVLRTSRAQRVLRRWPEIVGESLAEKSWPDRFEKGIVWVAVKGSAWAQELRLRKTTILERLASMCSEPGLFSDVRFGVRALRRSPDFEAEEPTSKKSAERRQRPWEH